MTETLHTHSSLELVPGLDCHEVDRRLFKANVASDVAQRTLAFYLFDLHDRGEAQSLGFKTVKEYAMTRLHVGGRRANELVQAGGMLHDLVDVDTAFLDGRLSWSKVLALMPVARVSNQDVWVERAMQMSVSRLKKAVAQVKLGQRCSLAGGAASYSSVSRDFGGPLRGRAYARNATVPEQADGR